jgi:hypothetical protein
MAGGPMVIRARVRARLLGLRLLTLDAYITAADDGSPILALTPAGRPGAARPDRAAVRAGAAVPAGLAVRADGAVPASSAVPGGAAVPSGTAVAARPRPDLAPGASVARARELVEEGALDLDQERRR